MTSTNVSTTGNNMNAGVNIFVSYSIADRGVVKEFNEYLSRFANVDFWDKSKEPGEDAWKSIHKWIDDSDLVIAVITKDVIEKSMSVSHEISRAIAKNKLVIPLVGEGVSPAELGFLGRVTYETLSKENMGRALQNMRDRVLRIKSHKIAAMNKEKADKEFKQLLWVVGGIATFAFLMKSS